MHQFILTSTWNKQWVFKSRVSITRKTAVRRGINYGWREQCDGIWKYSRNIFISKICGKKSVGVHTVTHTVPMYFKFFCTHCLFLPQILEIKIFLVGLRNTEYFHIPSQHIPFRPPCSRRNIGNLHRYSHAASSRWMLCNQQWQVVTLKEFSCAYRSSSTSHRGNH